MSPAYRKLRVLLILIAVMGFLPTLPLESSPGTEQILGYPHFIYPLLRRYRINSHFDHTSPDYTRDRWIRIYTQQDVYRNGTCDGPDCHCDGTVCTYYDDETPPITDPLWDQDHDDYTCGIGWLWYDGHPGYDLGCVTGTPVYAMQAGTVITATNCVVYINHGSGYKTGYLHLSRIDVSTGQQVALGQQIGLSGACGATSAHLHYEVQLNGAPIDPWGWEQNLWAGNNPFPLGYRDQNGTSHGPLQLDDAKIRDAWIQNAARLGSPVSNDCFIGTCPPTDASPTCPAPAAGETLPEGDVPQVTGIRQNFERGYIYYCQGATSATVKEYASRTFLPRIVASDDSAAWNSTVYIRNLGNGAAKVSITFYEPSGWILDSRT